MFTLFKGKQRPSASTGGTFNAGQAAAAKLAVEYYDNGNVEFAEKMLTKHGLTLDAARAYVASLAYAPENGAEEVAEEAAEPSRAQPGPIFAGGMERMKFDTPNGYVDTIEQRGKLIAGLWAQFGEGWQVESFSPETIKVIRGAQPSIRPGAAVYENGTKATTGSAEAVAAGHAAYGRTMVGYNPFTRTAETAVLPPVTVEIRDQLLRKNPRQKPWELEILPIFGVRDGEGYLAKVIVQRADQVSSDRDKTLAYWLGIARNTIGHSGWWVKLDDKQGVVELIAADPLRIPDRVGYDYATIDAGSWGDIPIGTDGYGEPVQLDLASNPHTMVVGKTNSGKSVALCTIVFAALAHRWGLVVIDPTKNGLDFEWARGYVRDKGWGCDSFADAQAAIESVYAEGERRKKILVQQKAKKWTELSAEFRQANDFNPIMVVIDEFTSLAKMLHVPKLLPDYDPRRVAAEETNLAKEIILVTTDNGLRELRFVGIHFSLGTQVWNVTDIGNGAGGMRTNMGNRLQFGRASNSQLTMAFSDPHEAADAYELAHNAKAELTDDAAASKKGRPGRGIAELDGVGYVAFQGAYAETDELVAELAKRGIHPREVSTDEDVTDLGEMTFDLGDLETELELDDVEEAEAETVIVDPAWAATGSTSEDEDPFATPAPSARVSPARAPGDEESDPFAEPAVQKKVFAGAQADDFNWDD
ncbi:FtsK/SpoIIIE domain-containing protein [Arthrobacter sp. 162MFSha1.1]|uniref:FtsK/SpoIIIE domain-containing protein n=1 Tax=Arthrobacter sp. 162MFSha1.1 TaxID=1151119 RepID=UPI00039A4F11|nr:FtsK/SpoIIIE domain-containing protein [Arthrobacter sp. 162MFSha1.1]